MILILAPHVDDELIGCWSLIYDLAKVGKNPIRVLYTEDPDSLRKAEAKDASRGLGYEVMFGFVDSIHDQLKHQPQVVLAPDPYFELHPAHKEVGSVAWNQCRQWGIPFVAYSTNMNTPYLQELPDHMANLKRAALNKYFESQTSLWTYDHRYWLFEGMCQFNSISWQKHGA